MLAWAATSTIRERQVERAFDALRSLPQHAGSCCVQRLYRIATVRTGRAAGLRQCGRGSADAADARGAAARASSRSKPNWAAPHRSCAGARAASTSTCWSMADAARTSRRSTRAASRHSRSATSCWCRSPRSRRRSIVPGAWYESASWLQRLGAERVWNAIGHDVRHPRARTAETPSSRADAASLYRRRRADRRRQDESRAAAGAQLRQRARARAGRRQPVPRAFLSQPARRRVPDAAVLPVPARATAAGPAPGTTCSRPCASPTTCSTRTGCSRGSRSTTRSSRSTSRSMRGSRSMRRRRTSSIYLQAPVDVLLDASRAAASLRAADRAPLPRTARRSVCAVLPRVRRGAAADRQRRARSIRSATTPTTRACWPRSPRPRAAAITSIRSRPYCRLRRHDVDVDVWRPLLHSCGLATRPPHVHATATARFDRARRSTSPRSIA